MTKQTTAIPTKKVSMLPSEAAKQGVFLYAPNNPPTIGKEINYYARNGEKRYGIVHEVSGDYITIQDQKTQKMVKMRMAPDERPDFFAKQNSKKVCASILDDAFAYFMESKKEGGLADVFNETYTRTGQGEDKYMACSELMMDYESAFQRDETGGLTDEDNKRPDAEQALRDIVGDDPNYSERTEPGIRSASAKSTAKVYASILDQMLDDNAFEKVALADDAEFFQQAGVSGGSWYAQNEDTGEIEEGAENIKEVSQAHREREDHTGISRPETKTPRQVAERKTSHFTAAPELWHTRRAAGDVAQDNDSILDEVLTTLDKAEKNAPLEKKQLSDEEVKSQIDGWFKEAKTPRQIMARLEKMSDINLYNKTFATSYLKSEAGNLGYEFLEPNTYMNGLSDTAMKTFETVKVKGSMKEIRGKGDKPASEKTAANDKLLNMPSLHRQASVESQVRGVPTIRQVVASFTAKNVEKMFSEGANLERIYHAGRVRVGSQQASKAVRDYITTLKHSKTAKIKLSQLDCQFLKQKLAVHNPIIGASKCASCSFRQGMHCGLTGGTLISFPGMQKGDTKHKVAAGAPVDGHQLINEFDLRHQVASEIEFRAPERAEIEMPSVMRLDIE